MNDIEVNNIQRTPKRVPSPYYRKQTEPTQKTKENIDMDAEVGVKYKPIRPLSNKSKFSGIFCPYNLNIAY